MTVDEENFEVTGNSVDCGVCNEYGELMELESLSGDTTDDGDLDVGE